ncbi:MAG: glycosyltransferase [Alphaproteobacteria bacterium]|nr:glycosyltransferase [Alphaproteobacteria bacterium]
MTLTVLSVAYALAPVAPDTAGGAEQVLLELDRALVHAGHHSLVIAAAGSQIVGDLIATSQLPPRFSDAARRQIQRCQRLRIEEALQRWEIDLVHAHGSDFAEHLPHCGVPTLVTLHMPTENYPTEAMLARGPETYFNCVSASQRRRFPRIAAMLPEIENGVPVDELQARHAQRNFAVALGRICPEKGFHHALDAAGRAQVPLLLAGHVFPYEYHQRYFDDEIRRRLSSQARFLGAIGFARKRRLLTAARCLLVPSLVPETSSLVAMEALACGTPVVAFPAGALAEIIEPGVTGFLVDDTEQMAEAIPAAARLDREHCRAVARRRFPVERMVARYFVLYHQLTRRGTPGQRCSA